MVGADRRKNYKFIKTEDGNKETAANNRGTTQVSEEMENELLPLPVV